MQPIRRWYAAKILKPDGSEACTRILVGEGETETEAQLSAASSAALSAFEEDELAHLSAGSDKVSELKEIPRAF